MMASNLFPEESICEISLPEYLGPAGLQFGCLIKLLDSSGKEKLVVITHRNLLEIAKNRYGEQYVQKNCEVQFSRLITGKKLKKVRIPMKENPKEGMLLQENFIELRSNKFSKSDYLPSRYLKLEKDPKRRHSTVSIPVLDPKTGEVVFIKLVRNDNSAGATTGDELIWTTKYPEDEPLKTPGSFGPVLDESCATLLGCYKSNEKKMYTITWIQDNQPVELDESLNHSEVNTSPQDLKLSSSGKQLDEQQNIEDATRVDKGKGVGKSAQRPTTSCASNEDGQQTNSGDVKPEGQRNNTLGDSDYESDENTVLVQTDFVDNTTNELGPPPSTGQSDNQQNPSPEDELPQSSTGQSNNQQNPSPEDELPPSNDQSNNQQNPSAVEVQPSGLQVTTASRVGRGRGRGRGRGKRQPIGPGNCPEPVHNPTGRSHQDVDSTEEIQSLLSAASLSEQKKFTDIEHTLSMEIVRKLDEDGTWRKAASHSKFSQVFDKLQIDRVSAFGHKSTNHRPSYAIYNKIIGKTPDATVHHLIRALEGISCDDIIEKVNNMCPDSGIRLSNVPLMNIDKICDLLDDPMKCYGNQYIWEKVAAFFKVSTSDIRLLRTRCYNGDYSPTDQIIRKLNSALPGLYVTEFITVMAEIDKMDVVEILKPLINHNVSGN